jgi:hypothetical protein
MRKFPSTCRMWMMRQRVRVWLVSDESTRFESEMMSFTKRRHRGNGVDTRQTIIFKRFWEIAHLNSYAQ